MTKEEVKNIIGAMLSSYPNYKPNNMALTVDTWTTMLIDYDYPTISKALQKYILSDKTGFAPAIGQIIAMIDTEPSNEPLEAWDLVRKAINNSTYHSEEEYAKLPVECQKAIGSPANLREMAQMDWETVESVEQSHFIRSYQAVIKRMDEEKRLPQNLRNYTQQIAMKMQEPRAIEQKEEEPPQVKVDVEEGSMVAMVKKRMEERRELSKMQE
jgi:hypothetical protein